MRDALEDLVARATRWQDPGAGMAAVVEMRRLLDQLESAHVANAVRAGWSWQRIADRLGVTRQAAHHRHAARVGTARGPDPAEIARSRLVVSGDARQAVELARRSAAALGARRTETEHLLLGLLQVEGGVAAEALRAAGIHLADAWAQAARVQEDAGAPPVGLDPGRPPISPSAREALEQSLREAVRRGDAHLGVEHLLLALLRAPGGRAVQLLMALGTSPAHVEGLLRRRDVQPVDDDQAISGPVQPRRRPGRPPRSTDRAESSRPA
jgi:Clp amino terminal domain, pathogenicity island component